MSGSFTCSRAETCVGAAPGILVFFHERLWISALTLHTRLICDLEAFYQPHIDFCPHFPFFIFLSDPGNIGIRLRHQRHCTIIHDCPDYNLDRYERPDNQRQLVTAPREQECQHCATPLNDIQRQYHNQHGKHIRAKYVPTLPLWQRL